MSESTNYLLTIDVAHPPLRPEEVESELTSVLSRVRGSSQYRAVKVIHGYGSHGRGGSTRDTVRNWAFQFRHRLKNVIEGESYNLFDADTQRMRDECGQLSDPDFGNSNQGITILWIK